MDNEYNDEDEKEYLEISSGLDISPGFSIPHPTEDKRRSMDSVIWMLKYFTAGGIAGFVSRTVTAPIDRLKVLYQVHSHLISSTASSTGRSVGLIQGFNAIYKEGGVRGFWRGNGTNIMKVVPESSLFFALFELFKFYYGHDRHIPFLQSCIISASIASFITSIIMYPLETVKARWMTSPSGTYQSVGDCLKKLKYSEGWYGFYKGLPIQLCGTEPYAGINLTLYEMAKVFYLRKNGGVRPSAYWCLTFGSVASIFGQIVAYPFAVIRTRLQTQGTPGHPQIYERGGRQCIQEIWKSEGWRGFYRGLLPTYMKTIPAMGITLGVYEVAVKNFGL